MQIKIANKNYSLYFGWGFLEDVNNRFGFILDIEGADVNTRSNGYPFMIQGLESYDPIAVMKTIQAATATEHNKPAKENIQKLIETKLTEGPKEYKTFVDEIKEEIKKEQWLQAYQNLNL